jgi:hypothetical protein
VLAAFFERGTSARHAAELMTALLAPRRSVSTIPRSGGGLFKTTRAHEPAHLSDVLR